MAINLKLDRSLARVAETAATSTSATSTAYRRTALSAEQAASQQIRAAVRSQTAMRTNLAALQAKAAALPAGSAEQQAAMALAIQQQTKLDRALGVTAASTARFGSGAKTAERDLNKMTRGIASGSGVLGRFSRSLAFASTGFIAFATAAVVIKESIVHAEDLAKAQRSLDVAIKHTGGDVKELQPHYEAVAKAAAQFGISQVEATTGLARATVLTGNAAAAQRAYQEALVISKATGKEFNVALTATSKAQEGITTSLRRYGILVTPTMKGTEQFALVMKRFGGQAVANTTASEKLSASFANLEASIGKALLPTFEKIVTGLTNWFTKMTETGRLQNGVNAVIRDATAFFSALGDVIGVVDRITGSFANTLKIVLALAFIPKATAWIRSLELLAAKWGLVAGAATAAGTAETRALAAGGAGTVAGGATSGVILPAGVAPKAVAGIEKTGIAATLARSRVVALGASLGELAAIAVAPIVIPIVFKQEESIKSFLERHLGGAGKIIGDLLLPTSVKDFLGVSLVEDIFGGRAFKQQLASMGRDLAKFDAQVVRTRHNVLGARAQLANVRVSRDQAQQELQAATVEERSTRGTSQHAAAVNRLNAARYNLTLVTQQLQAAEQKLNRTQAANASARRRDSQATSDFTKKLAQLARDAQALTAAALTPPGAAIFKKGDIPSPETVQIIRLKTYTGQMQRLEQSLASSNPKMARVVHNLIQIAQALGRIPSSTSKTILFILRGQFEGIRVGPGGDIFPAGPRAVPGGGSTKQPPKGPKQFPSFALTSAEEIAQARAQLTRGTQDDVKAAREVVARIKKAIAGGHLHGKALQQALQLEAEALGTIWSAEDAAAQKRAARAQAAKERIQKQIEAAMDPVRLELALARAELSGSTPAVIRALKALRANARKMLESGKLSAQQQITEIQQIISLNQQIKDAATQATVQFQVPAKLALRLARDQALGRDTTKDLLSIRKAILHFIKTHRKNIAALTDAYNQLAAINEQIGGSVSSAFGFFKKASVKALTANMGLTAEQRRQLEQRLSQVGPGGTVPGTGVGAAGFVIGPDGRPIKPGRPPTIKAQEAQTVSPARLARILERLERLADRPIYLVVDGKVLATSTTKNQQHHRRRNPSSRRGPNAATATA